jgi:hypothetical protein
VYGLSGGKWSQITTLSATNSSGNAVALSGTTAMVGATGYPEDAAPGAVLVYSDSDGVWTQESILGPSTPTDEQNFGDAVAISGNTALFGADGESGNDSLGIVYVFTNTDGVWSQQAEITDPGGVVTDEFGATVAISGNTALIGSEYGTAAYVYTESGGVWSEQAQLSVPGEDLPAHAVALSGAGTEALIAGQLGSYVFTETDGTWTEQAQLA